MPHSVLIVEDNAVTANLLQFNLKRAGFDVFVASNGATALAKAGEVQFDVVVTDHQMPGITGTEMCRSLRTLPQYRSTPVLLCTAKGLELDRSSVLEECGVTEILFKPVSPRHLLSSLNDLLAPQLASS